MPSLLTVATLPVLVAGHGRITTPSNRVGGTLEIAGKNDDCNIGYNTGGLPPKQDVCGYQNRGTRISSPTNCKSEYMTGHLIKQSPSDGDCSKVDASHSAWQMPWAAPGKAKLWSVCGVNGGHQNPKDKDKHGKSYASPRDGLDLPPSLITTKWEIGKSAEVGFALTKHHGGGYQWRLCPGKSANSHPSASCFEANVLKFAGSTTTVRWTDGRTSSFHAINVGGDHVTPAGSQFRTIQIPLTESYKSGERTEPCKGCHGHYGVDGDDIRQEWDFSLIDRVHVPDVQTGHAWLQWRWDNEHQDQVWTNCADIEIVAASPTPSPSPSFPGSLQATLSGRCLDLPGGDTTNGALLWMWDCYGGDAQQFSFQDGQLVYLPDSSKCVDLLGDDTTNGNQLGLWDCYYGESQQWGFDSNYGTVYLASSGRDATKCVAASTDIGGPVYIWDCDVGDAFQIWQVADVAANVLV